MKRKRSKNLIYLASPYSHKHKHVRLERELQISTIGSKLIEQGYHIFGPITESHRYSEINPNLGAGWHEWKEHDEFMLSKCDELWVVKLKGWEQSVGVKGEIDYATEYGIPISYIDPESVK